MKKLLLISLATILSALFAECTKTSPVPIQKVKILKFWAARRTGPTVPSKFFSIYWEINESNSAVDILEFISPQHLVMVYGGNINGGNGIDWMEEIDSTTIFTFAVKSKDGSTDTASITVVP